MRLHSPKQPVRRPASLRALLALLIYGLLSASALMICPAAATSYGAGLANFQGQLLDSQTHPYPSGSYDMEVSIYDALTGGNRVWGPAIYDGSVSTGHASRVYVAEGGHFSIVLGDKDTASRSLVDAIPVATTSPLYIEFRAGDLQTATPIAPRQQLLSLPYAIQTYNVRDVGTVHASATNRIGIGVTNPAAKLDVNGDMKVRGSATVGSLQLETLLADSATVGSSLAVNALSVNGDLHVTGSITASGAAFPRTSASVTVQYSTFTWDNTVTIISDPQQKWQCYLSKVLLGNSQTYTNRCKVAYTGSAWQLTASTAGFNQATACSASCLKLR